MKNFRQRPRWHSLSILVVKSLFFYLITCSFLISAPLASGDGLDCQNVMQPPPIGATSNLWGRFLNKLGVIPSASLKKLLVEQDALKANLGSSKGLTLIYDQPVTRHLQELSGIFGPDFVRQVKGLNVGELTVDSGTGLGLLPMELAEKKNTVSLGVDIRDYWSEIERIAEGRITNLDFGFENNGQALLIKTIGGLRWDAVVSIAKAVGIEFYDKGGKLQGRGEQEITAIRTKAQEVCALAVKKRKRLEKNLSLEIIQGDALAIFPQLLISKSRATLITDLYGSFFYSKYRLELIKSYYDLLAQNGKAFVFLGVSAAKGKSTPLPLDSVIVLNKKLELVEYLVQRFPTIFSMKKIVYESRDCWILIIKKDSGYSELPLQFKRDESRMKERFGRGDYHFPTGVIYYPVN